MFCNQKQILSFKVRKFPMVISLPLSCLVGKGFRKKENLVYTFMRFVANFVVHSAAEIKEGQFSLNLKRGRRRNEWVLLLFLFFCPVTSSSSAGMVNTHAVNLTNRPHLSVRVEHFWSWNLNTNSHCFTLKDTLSSASMLQWQI